MIRSHVSLGWLAGLGGRLLVSISVGREGGATDDRFFFSPHTPADHVKPQSPVPPPDTKRGAAWKEKPESAEVGTWRREEVQTLGG